MENVSVGKNFDNLASKFDKNIYGSTKGQLRHELLLYYLQDKVEGVKAPLEILDAGGGTGKMTEAMLKLGHKVTLTDISSEALQMAKKNLGEHKNLTIHHGDILSLPDTQQFDLVICHAVLEWLQEPLPVINKLVSLTKHNGYMSLSFFNYDAQLFGNLLYGNFDYVQQGMKKKNIVRLSPNNPQKPKYILSHLKTLPVDILQMAGIRCFHDYLKDLDKQVSLYSELKAFEIQYGSQEPYLWLGKYFLVISQKH
ncbi:methyltransferase domain-containing protein [Paraglaciecola sp. 2405UD69-4]|uniref:methyltransferase domain-containing protein n=1 Tax=Paraglaciecola sp. 2405UD69-4 TaxID=3391836 RepID=UPI0039C9445D